MKAMKLCTGWLAEAVLVLFAAFMPLLLSAQTATVTLTIRVVNVRNPKGLIRVALFQSSEGFPGDASRAIRVQAVPIDPKTLSAEVVLAGIPPGVYAVSAFHDENRNGKLDKNFLGMPKEGYGSSNNPKKKMGPPTFEESSFSLERSQSVQIHLLY